MVHVIGFCLWGLASVLGTAAGPNTPAVVAAYCRDAGYESVRVHRDGSDLLAKGSAGTKTVLLAVDTGAWTTTLWDTSARRLRLPLAVARPDPTGGRDATDEAVIADFRLGPLRSDRLTCRVVRGAAIDAGRRAAGRVRDDGMLGLAQLRDGAAVIDYPGGRLWLASPARAALNRMQGRWVVRHGSKDGRPLPADEAGQWSLEFQGERVLLEAGGRLRTWTAEVNPAAGPATLDVVAPDGGPGYCGVFRWEGTDLRWCFWAGPGTATAPPAAFRTEPGDGYLDLVFRPDPPRERPPPPRVIMPRQSELGRRLAPAGYARIPLVLKPDGHLHVAAKAGGRDLDLLVDTGSSANVLPRASAEPAGWVPTLTPSWPFGPLPEVCRLTWLR
jgi:uncharacterized protein (TIGR03067 family)